MSRIMMMRKLIHAQWTCCQYKFTYIVNLMPSKSNAHYHRVSWSRVIVF